MATGDVTAVAVTVNSNEYVALVDGGVHSIAGIQADYSGSAIRVAFGAGPIAVDTADFIIIDSKTPFREVISAGTVIWGLAYSSSAPATAKARVYRVER